MFCPKCGEQIPEGAKFCKACGEKIAKKDTPVSAKQNVSSEKGAINKKAVLFGAAALIAVVAVVLIVIVIIKSSGSATAVTNAKKGGFASYEAVVDAYLTSAFNRDAEAVIHCFPEEMQPDIIKLYNDYRSGIYTTDSCWFSFINIYSENQYSYEINGPAELEQSEINELQTKYGIQVDEGYAVDTLVSVTVYENLPDIGISGYNTETPRISVKVGKIGKSWYLIGIDDLKYYWSGWEEQWYNH